MSIDQETSTGTDAGIETPRRGLRAFGILRRHEVVEPAVDAGPAEPRATIRYIEDPDVARRIAAYVGQAPGDTDLTWVDAS